MTTPILDYSTPRVFFSGAYRFRSWNGLLGLVGMSVFCAGFGYGASRVRPLNGPGAAVFAAVSLACFAGTAYFAWGWLRGREDALRITEDGIEYGGRMWPWQRITRFGGKRYANGVTLECSIGPNVLIGEKSFPVTPSLSDDQYVDLAVRLSTFLRLDYPHVEVARRAVPVSD